MPHTTNRRQFLQTSAAAMVVLALMGTMQRVSRAAENDGGPVQKKAATEAPKKESGELRKMAISVRDEQGRPLSGVNVHASVWEIEPGEDRFPNRDYTTNEMGMAEIEIPRRLLILRLWPSKAGYVPQFIGFEQGMHEEGRLIPDAYDFTLKAGHRLSGFVVDVDGKPIAKASVQVRVKIDEPSRGVKPKPIINGWLAEGTDAAITGEDGRWEITNAPARKKKPDYEFRFASDPFDQYAADPFTVVGLNIDNDASAARGLSQNEGWNWAQNYLGDDSDMMRQLGVSSVPAYYTIGPDGKLIGSSNTWEETEKLLSDALR